MGPWYVRPRGDLVTWSRPSHDIVRTDTFLVSGEQPRCGRCGLCLVVSHRYQTLSWPVGHPLPGHWCVLCISVTIGLVYCRLSYAV